MLGDRSANDPVIQFCASLKDRMTKAGVEVSTLSGATAIPATRLHEILNNPGTVRLAEISAIASYFGVSLTSFFG